MTENKKGSFSYMITQDGCGACAEAEKMLENAIKEGKVKPINVKTKEGYELAEKHNVQATPTLINIDGELEQKCYISKDGTKMYCDDGTKKEI